LPTEQALQKMEAQHVKLQAQTEFIELSAFPTSDSMELQSWT
jgi:hypothetical protein